MIDFLTRWGAEVSIGLSALAIIYGGFAIKSVLNRSPGNERMREISQAIQDGARAYLNRQYEVIAIVAVVITIILWLITNVWLALGFLIGAILSGASGYVGMSVSVRSNARVAEAARGGVPPALAVAFRSGSVTGLLVVGMALIGVSGYYVLLDAFTDLSQAQIVGALVGLGFGGSLISIFARLGGGIFTKAADVGADLVGKLEQGLPEDDPRNPAVIADNVGDNVGDCAGMAADLFETYAVTAVVVMLLGVLTFDEARELAVFPLVLGGAAIVASIIGALTVRSKSGNVEAALYRGVITTAVIAALLFIPLSLWMTSDLTINSSRAGVPSPWAFWGCALIGIGVTALFFVITDFYTSTTRSPVKRVAKASQQGHATNIIAGLGLSMQSTVVPAIVVAAAVLGANYLAGNYGIAVAVMTQVSLAGIIVALDAFGPVTDNAGGIAEMADLPESVRKVTDPLDAFGNTTKAVTKGYAIASAVLLGLVLFVTWSKELADKVGHAIDFELESPEVLAGLIIGGLMVYLFTSLAMDSVGRAAGKVVDDTRAQFKENPGILAGTSKPDYGRTVSIVTSMAQKEMIIPALIPVVFPFVVGILSYEMLGGLLIGVIAVGFFIAVAMTSGGGAWDNAKKLIEDGAYGGKGSPAHDASITGDTVGDPYKDTVGPAINPMIKVANIVALIIVPIIV